MDQSVRSDEYVSHSVSLTAASRQTLTRIGDGEWGEFALVTAGIAYLLWKYFRNAAVALNTPGFPLVIEIRREEKIESYLSRVAQLIEQSYAQDAPATDNPLATVFIFDERLHRESADDRSEALQFRLSLDQGEIEILRSAAFESFVIDSLANSLAALLPELERFGSLVEDIDSLPGEELRLLPTFNQTTTPAWDYSTVVAMFEAQALRTPSAPALVSDGSLLTYASLNEKANRLAHHLRETHAVGPETMVGVLLERSELMIITVLGILKAGAAFVPIDTAYPQERIDYILGDTELPILITQSALAVREMSFTGKRFSIDVELPRLRTSGANPPLAAAPEHLAYVLYTSGSTGRPKGCLLEHRNLLNYIAWAASYYFPESDTGSFGLYSSLCFDFTLTNIFCPLVRGKSLRIYPQSQTIDEILARAFRAGSGIDTMKLTPSHIFILEHLKLTRSGVRKVIVGGEELTPRHISILRKIDPAIEIYNEYGPTEATVGCIVKAIESEAAPVLIGAPIANMRVYILDETGKPAPLGVRGEIAVAGDGLARGYHRRPDITAARFVENPFRGEKRIYRTGDIGRWLPDGQIQSFGRLDEQVKIRGYRVELGEIEAAIMEHPRVNAAAVAVRETNNGARKLVGYVKSSATLSAAELRTFLAERLPGYMVPADVVFVTEFRLNANGKLDRTALPAPEDLPAPAPAAESSRVLTELVAIWRELFETADVSPTSRFFDLGGDSLLAVQLIARIWKAFNVEVGIDDIFERQSLEALAGLIERSSPNATLIRPRARDSEPPLSYQQQGLWFISQLEGPSAAYNLSCALRFEGELDVARLEAAIAEMARRHEVLRTIFPSLNGRAVQSIEPHQPVSLRVLNAPTEARALALMQWEAAYPIDLATGPLHRTILYRVNPRLHMLFVVMHHIVTDAASFKVLIEELAALYQQRSLPELAVQYADYAMWQREYLQSETARQQLAAAKAALLGAPDLLALPTDRPRPEAQSFRGKTLPFHWDRDIADALRELARSEEATLYMVLLSAYALLLSRFSAQNDIVIGSSIANRTVSEIEPLIGFFLNTLPLRIDLAGAPSFKALLARVKQIALENFARREVPFDQIVEAVQPERNLSRSPIFQVMLNFESATSLPELPGLTVTPVLIESNTAKFDLTLHVEESEGGLTGGLEYSTDLFDDSTAERLVSDLRALVCDVVAIPQVTAPTAKPKPQSRSPLAREALLMQIWREVLQIPTVGLHDNFFELGGDSILSIQVVSRANKAGVRITTKQFFQHQTIAGLAAAPEEQSDRVSQVESLGEAPLTPIQHWFFAQKLDAPALFNQAMLIQVPANVDPARLAEAVRQVYAHHDALRLSFSQTAGGWTQQIAAVDDSHSLFAVQDVAGREREYLPAMRAAAKAAEQTLDLARGPLIAVRLFRIQGSDSARLFVVVHHLAIDGVSWRILLEDLHNAYQQIPLPPKTAHFREWALHLWQLAQSATFAGQASFWKQLVASDVEPIPVDDPQARAINDVADAASVTFDLSETETTSLLRHLPQSYNVRITDVLLTALALCFKTGADRSRIRVDLESHGRHAFDSGLDLSRTVGWFTSIYPVVLEVASSEPQAALSHVKRQLLSIPAEGFGYSLLRYLSSDETVRRQLSEHPPADILFNYHGQIDSALSRDKGWTLASEDLAAVPSYAGARTHLFEIIAAVVDGQLHVNWSYSRRIHSQATVEALGEHFKQGLRALAALAPTRASETIAERYALSPLQEGLLFHSLYDQDPTSYFQQFSFAVEGALDLTALRQAWNNAVKRHAILRTAIHWQDQEHPVHVVFRSVDLPWETHDWRALTAERCAEAFDEFLIQDRQRGFRLQTAPLCRCTLIHETDSRLRFCWSSHHLILDGWSTASLLKEVFEDYVSLASTGRLAHASAAPNFREYIEWLHRRPRDENEAFWRTELRGFRAPTRLPVTSRHSAGEAIQHAQTLQLDESLTSQLQAIVRTHRLTLNVLLRGVWAILLSRYSGSDDVVFGVTVSGRPPELEGIESMAGVFINTIPVRLRIPAEQSLLSWLGEVHAAQAVMEQHAYSSLIDIQKWSDIPAGTPLFDALMVFENFPVSGPRNVESGAVDIQDVRSYSESSYPLTLIVVPESRLGIRLSYDARRFAHKTIEQMLGHITTLLTSFVDEPTRACKAFYQGAARPEELSSLPIVIAHSDNRLVHQWFEARVAAHPNATAVVYEDHSLTYGELNAKANQVAHYLLALGVRPDQLVALCVERSLEMVIGLLGILKAGGAYVPLDPRYPAERLQYMIEDAAPGVLLTQEPLRERLPATTAKVVSLDRDWNQIAKKSVTNPDASALGLRNDHLAYVIYTSGSTGRPKGVMVEHRNVTRLFSQTERWFAFNERDVWTLFHSFAFDFSVWELWGALLYGGRVVIVPYSTARAPEDFYRLVCDSGVTVLNQTPSAFTKLIDAERRSTQRHSLRLVIFGGEALELHTLRPWVERHGAQQPQLVNMYGITETTVHVTYHPLREEEIEVERRSVIGKPLPDLRTYVLDRHLHPVPMGVAGELYIAGAGVVRGYLNRPELTRERFLADPFSTDRKARLYKTGDLGRWQADGTLEYLGRNDQQVKIRGFRIELGEIEAQLSACRGVREAVVIAREDTPGDKRLVAYLIPDERSDLSLTELRAHLVAVLPEYMVPGAYVTLDSMPLTPNGKLDRQALPAPQESAYVKSAYAEPVGETEAALAAIWQDLLHIERIGRNDHFFELGGHSLLAVRLISKVERAFQRQLPISALFANPTIEKLAAALSSQKPATKTNGVVPIRGGGPGAPLFLIPGAGGNVLYFHALAQRLAKTHAIYALEPVGLDGSESPLTSVEALAERQIERIRPIAGSGPYFLAGHSFGAGVALEMSRQLIAKGATVGRLAILDAYAPTAIADPYWKSWDEVDWLLGIAHNIATFIDADLGFTRDELTPLNVEERLTYMISRIAQRSVWFADAGPDRLRAYLNVYQANFKALYAPVPEALPVPITLLCSTEADAKDIEPSPEIASLRADPSWGWSRFSRFPVQVLNVPGTHLTMMLEPQVGKLAAHLDALLDQAPS